MQYPLISEYIEAIRYAEDNFDKLSNLRPVLDDNGNPVMSSGNFAVVFKMKDIETDKLYAVKCFIREQEERQERYREIIKVLDEIKSPYFVSTHYYDKELFVDTTQDDETEFPVLVMDWVDGISLDDYMKAIESKQFLRELLANQFQKLVCWLLPKHYAHGDLKPDNILVRDDGSIVLVDYDGMFVPSLRGKDALEMGTPMYRHIGRTLSFYNEYIDDFAAVKILLLLKVNALSAISYNQYAAGNNVEFMRLFEHLLNHSTIAPLLAAYIMVSTFGRIDRQQVSCLLSDNSDFNYNKESSLQDLAREGDTIAMQELASLYANGIYVPQNTSKAMQWNMLAKLLGNVNVTCGICKCISDNNDFIINNEAILSQLKKNRINFAYCKEGERLYSDKKYEQAIYWFQKAADAGNSAAQKNLAICYFNGYGVEKDVEKAIYWWQKAADAGNSTAQNSLAYRYFAGDGVEKDVEKAVYWWQKAADAGNSGAEYMLELCCKMFNIKDSVNINPHEIGNIGECNTASYSDDGKRCLRYWGTYGDEYKIKDGTEVLCDDSFNDLYSECDGHYLKTLCLPSSLKRIGNNVFCASISEIICDASNFYTNDGFLLSSDNETLYRYFGHKKVVDIPKGVKYIKGGAFSEKDVEKVIISDTVIHIGDNPFAGCDNLREIVSNSKKFIVENDTLYDIEEKRLIGCWNCRTSHIYIQNGTKSIGKNAFFGLNFQYVDIPGSIENIDKTSFYRCFKLCNIAIPSHQYKRIFNLIPSYIKEYVLEDNGLPF